MFKENNSTNPKSILYVERRGYRVSLLLKNGTVCTPSVKLSPLHGRPTSLKVWSQFVCSVSESAGLVWPVVPAGPHCVSPDGRHYFEVKLARPPRRLILNLHLSPCSLRRLVLVTQAC